MATATSAGVPVRLLHEAEGHPITVELKSGDLYRGSLQAAEDSMNVQLASVIHTARDGRVTKCVRFSMGQCARWRVGWGEMQR